MFLEISQNSQEKTCTRDSFFNIVAGPVFDNTYSPYFHAVTVHRVIMHINQLKGIYFPKLREIVEVILFQTKDAIPVMCVPKWSLVFSIKL